MAQRRVGLTWEGSWQIDDASEDETNENDAGHDCRDSDRRCVLRFVRLARLG